MPWSTGFEDGFCGYSNPGGFCFSTGVSSYDVVTEPVHSGRYAAAFTVVADGTGTGAQARCVRQGELPTEAYYGAWYFVPSVSSSAGVWNLIHFQGGSSSRDTLHYLWDVSLADNGTGGFRLSVYDFLRKEVRTLSATPDIPIGSWFHIEVYLKRAADSSGALSVYQDGETLLALTGLATDDSAWGQWYVGNLASDLTPTHSTLYVDDITISTSR
jgi:hypothetical protein